MGYLYKSICYPDQLTFQRAFLPDQRIFTPNPDGSIIYTRALVLINQNSDYYSFSGPIQSTAVGLYYTYSYPVKVDLYNQYGQIITSYPSVPNYFTWSYNAPYCDSSSFFDLPMNITLQNPPDNFNPSNLNPVDVFNSIGSGFLLVAVPLAVVWAGRHFLRPLFSK